VSEDLSLDAYAVLGVSVLATDDEIHRAYRAIARRMHPDTNPDPDAAAAFARVTSAYELLHDPARRRAYDLARAVQRGPRATRAAPGPTGNAAVRGPHARPAHRPMESAPPPSERPVSDTDEFALLGIIVKIVAVIFILLLLGVIFLSITAHCDNGLDIADACKLPTPTATSCG
jgi:curved DNA-binding protein CbpA